MPVRGKGAFTVTLNGERSGIIQVRLRSAYHHSSGVFATVSALARAAPQSAQATSVRYRDTVPTFAVTSSARMLVGTSTKGRSTSPSRP